MASNGVLHPGVDEDGKPCSVVYIEPGAILERGIWCNGCLLPAAIRVEILALTDDGFIPFMTSVWCDDCHHLCECRTDGC